MIKFSAWNIDAIGSPLGRQYDNLTRSLDIVGNIPDGWTWDVLLQIGDNLNIISLSPSEEGLHATLTADMLAIKGKYRLQLRASQADKIRHTNIITVDVLESISGDAKWPEVPSEFTQLEQRVQALAAETETAAAQAKDAAEGVANNAKAAQEAAGQAQTAQDAAQGSAKQAGAAAAAAADGAKTAADSAAAATQAAQSAGDAVRSAQASAQTATAQAQSAADAAQQAGQAKTAAETAAGNAEQSAQEAQTAAAVIPTPTKEDARKVPTVNAAGDGYELSNQDYILLIDTTLEEESLLNFSFENYYKSFIIFVKAPDGVTLGRETRVAFGNVAHFFTKGSAKFERIKVTFLGDVVEVHDFVSSGVAENYALSAYGTFRRSNVQSTSANQITTLNNPFSAGTSIQIWGVEG